MDWSYDHRTQAGFNVCSNAGRSRVHSNGGNAATTTGTSDTIGNLAIEFTFLNTADGTSVGHNTSASTAITLPQTDKVVMDLHLRAVTNNRDLNSITFTRRGAIPDTSLSNLRLVRDNNNNGTLEGTDTVLGTSTITAGMVNYAGAPLQTVTTTAATRLLLVADIAAGAAAGADVRFVLATSTDVVWSGGTDYTSYPVIGSAFSLAGPEVNFVRGGNVQVDDGGTDSPVLQLSTATTLTYTIQNYGSATLNLSGGTISGQVGCTATISVAAPATIASLSTSTTSFSVNASAASFSFNYTIVTNDPDENPYNFTVSGTAGTTTDLAFLRDLTTVPDGGTDTLPAAGFVVGSTTTVAYHIRNFGPATLTVTNPATITPTNCTVSVVSVPAATTTGTGYTVTTLNITPSAASFSFTYSLVCNGIGAKNPYDFTVNGTAAASGGAREIAGTVLTTSQTTSPFNFTTNGREQTAYSSAELALPANTLITGVRVFGTSLVPPQYNNLRVRLAHTTLAPSGAGTLTTSFDANYSAPLTTVLGPVNYTPSTEVTWAGVWYTFTFTSPFVYNGTSNLLVDWSYDSRTSTGFNVQFAGTRTRIQTSAGGGASSSTGTSDTSGNFGISFAYESGASGVLISHNTSGNGALPSDALMASLAQTDLVVLDLNLIALGTPRDVNSITFAKTGSIADAQVTLVKLVRDDNNNGVVDGTDTVLGTGSFSAGSITFAGAPLQSVATTVRVLLAVNLPAGLTYAQNLQVSLASSASVTWSGGTDLTTYPVTGTDFFVAFADVLFARSGFAIADGGIDNGNLCFRAAVATSVTFSIVNPSNAPVQLFGPAVIGGLSNCTVTVTTQPPSEVSAGTTGTTILSVTATAPGPLSFTYSLGTSLAGTKNPYNFTFQGHSNDLGSGAIPLTVNLPLAGGLLNALNDYQVQAASTKFLGIGQTVTTGVGRDVVYSFTAPTTGRYSFRAHFGAISNLVIYLVDTLPVGTSPLTVLDANILAASNRNTITTGGSEEIFDVALTASQTVFLIVDEVTLLTGNNSTFIVEVNYCVSESSFSNDTPSTAASLAQELEGRIEVNSDVDFYGLGTAPAGTRVFAMLDAAAASNTDTQLRITSSVDTLEYDNDDADPQFGTTASVIAGRALPNVPVYLRVNLTSTTTTMEPYRVYVATQGPSATATAESEPNDFVPVADSATNNYFTGTISSATDVDLFGFTASAGDLVFIALDADPTRTLLPFNATLQLLNQSGGMVLQVADGNATSSITSGAGSLTATNPVSPAEGLVYRVLQSGTYYARVSFASGTVGRDYLLSIAINGNTGFTGYAPTIGSTPPTNAYVGFTYNYPIGAFGSPLPGVVVSGLPAWLSYDPVTRTVSGTPAAGDIGVTGTITVTVSNGVNPDAIQQFQIVVTGPEPEIGVLRGTTAIADGGNDTLSGLIVGTPSAVTYTINNTGVAALNLTNPASIVSPVNCTVSITTAPTTPVAVSGSTTTVLSVTPFAPTFSFSYSIVNDDSTENPYNFAVSGTALVPFSGTYVINKAGGAGVDYTDIGAAMDDLELVGVSGPTVFEIYDDGGAYDSTASYQIGGDAAVLDDVPGLSATNTLTFRAANGEFPVINGGAASNPFSPAALAGISGYNISHLRFEDLEFIGAPTTAAGLMIYAATATSNIRVTGCKIHAIGAGPAIMFYGNGGITDDVMIRNNFVWGCFGDAGTNWSSGGKGVIGARRCGANWVIEHNTIVHVNASTGSSILFNNGSATPFGTVRNNVVYLSHSSAVVPFLRLDTAASTNLPTVSDRNVIFLGGLATMCNNTNFDTWTEWQFAGLDANSLNSDPLLVDVSAGTENLHLTAASPAMGLATGSTLNIDIDHQPRPMNTTADAGADEFPASTAPFITSAAPPNGYSTVPYNFTFTANGFPQTFAWTITSGGLPTGLTLNASSGLVSGTPTTNGSFNFTVTVSNGVNPDASQAYQIDIATPVPEIDILRGTTPIADGGSDLLFGLNTTTPTNVFYTIQNLGTGALTISNPAAFITGQVNCTVTILAQPAASVAASGSTLTLLSIQPTAPQFSFTFSLNSNDSDENPYNFTVDGMANDTVAGAIPLTLNMPQFGALLNATNDYQVQAASTKFTGLGQVVTTAPGRDVAFSFTAPAAGDYSMRAHFGSVGATSNWVIYVLSVAPTGTAPITINDTDIIAAANRNTLTVGGGEEVFSITLAASQQVFFIVDELAQTVGGTFYVEVTNTVLEAAGNDTPATAGAFSNEVEGSTTPAADVDFYDLGTPAAGSRIFAMTDTVAGSSGDTELRVTTSTDTLEYDDDDGTQPFGPATGAASVIAGTPTTGVQTYLRVNNFSATAQAEPYRLYAVIQPPSSNAQAEFEPNDTTAQATVSQLNYFSGVMGTTTDVDLYRFTGVAGDLVFIALDCDPTRTNLPWNGALALLDSNGNVLLAVNNANGVSSVTAGTGVLNSTTPNSPGEGIVARLVVSGTYYASVTYVGGTTGLGYLLSISKNGVTGGGLTVAPTITSGAPAPGAVGQSYSHQFTAYASPAVTWSVIAGSLPTGLSLNGTTGMLSGTPTATGNFAFTVSCTNGIGTDPTQACSLVINEAPTITSAAPVDGLLGTPYNHTFTATGTPATFTWSVTAGTLPAGLSLNGSTGALTGTPTATGAFSFTVTCSNGINPDDTEVVNMDINEPPQITSAAPPNGAVGVGYNHTYTATGFPAPTFSVSSGTLPAGLTLNATTGVLSGTPSAPGGVANFTVRADNGVGTPADQPASVTISEQPSITSGAPVAGVVGTPYNHAFTASGFPAPTFTVLAGSLPGGLSLSAAGVLSGTPTAPGGVANFTVRADNGFGTPSDQVVNLTINEAPTITSSPPPSGLVGTAYSHSFTVTGYPATFTWSVTVGTLPSGLVLNASSGLLSGTPTVTGNFAFTVTCSNGISPDDTEAVNMSINEPPTITSAVAPNGTLATAYSHSCTATGFPATFTWTVSSGALPAGLTLNASTGQISGTPTTLGLASGTITCSNGISPNATQNFNIDILPSNLAVMVVSRTAAVPDGSSDAIGNIGFGYPQTITYSIDNTGNSGLILNGTPDLVVLALTTNITSATVSTQPASTVAPAGTTVFTVTYTVTAAGAFTLGFSIPNNDPAAGKNPYNWTLDGTGVAAEEIAVSRLAAIADGGSEALGSVPELTAVTLTYTINNVGSGPLTITTPVTISGQTNCTVTVDIQPSTTVAAFGSTTLVITVTPLAGAFGFTVNVANSDADENPYDWSVSGSGKIKSKKKDSGGCAADETRNWFLLSGLLPLSVLIWRRRRATA